jgi:competence protein ComEC
VVVRATYGSFDALLTGDAYKDVERALVADLGPGVEVLKVGHHGSDTSTDPELLDGIRPQVALVSVGRGNRYGHPRTEVLERLRVRGIELRRTDQEGTLKVIARRDGRFDVYAAGPGPSR